MMQQDLMRQQQAATSQAGIQAQTGMGGMAQLGSMFNLGMSPFQAQWQPLQNQAGLIGDANILSQGTKTSQESGGIITGLF